MTENNNRVYYISFGLIIGGGILMILGFIGLIDQLLKHTEVKPPVVNVAAAAPPPSNWRPNVATLILVAKSGTGFFMEQIPNYASMEDCVEAGTKSRTKWYGAESMPKDMVAAYSCVPGPDFAFGVK